MRRSRLLFVGLALVALLLFSATVAYAQPVEAKRCDKSPTALEGALQRRDGDGIEGQSLSEYYAGYIYLSSHQNGGTYTYSRGDSIYVSCDALDPNNWGDYEVIISVWDRATSQIVQAYTTSYYVYYSQSVYANIDTSGLQSSTGRYEVDVVLWDDYYQQVEDVESFNLNLVEPHNVYANISLVSPNPAVAGHEVFFSGSGADSYGHAISGYRWRSSISGALSYSQSFSSTTLPPGAHTIYFQTGCSQGGWSPEQSVGLTIAARQGDDVSCAIDSITPNRAVVGSTFSFAGHASNDTSGHPIVGYRWTSSVNGPISSSPSFTTASLTPGLHTMYFKAMCSNGVWSPDAVMQIVVDPPLATSAQTPSISGKLKRGRSVTFKSYVAPSDAMLAGGTTVSLYHSETKTVKKKVGRRYKRVKVQYWRLRGVVAMAPMATGELGASYRLRWAGKWKAVVNYSGSTSFQPCTSGEKVFKVK